MAFEIVGDTIFLGGKAIAVLLPDALREHRAALLIAVQTGRKCYAE